MPKLETTGYYSRGLEALGRVMFRLSRTGPDIEAPR